MMSVLTMPIAAMSASIVVGPTNRKPLRLRSVARACDSGNCVGTSSCERGRGSCAGRYAHEAIDIRGRESRDTVGDESFECLPEGLALVQYRTPGESGLEAFQDETLKHAGLVVNGESPFVVVVVTDEFVVGGPGRADEAVAAPHEPIGEAQGKRGVV